MLSNIVEVLMHLWAELRGVKWVTVRGDITVFRGTFKFDNFYFNYHIEAYQVNFSPFSRFGLRISNVHRSVPPNVHLSTVVVLLQKRAYHWTCINLKNDFLHDKIALLHHNTCSKWFYLTVENRLNSYQNRLYNSFNINWIFISFHYIVVFVLHACSFFLLI